MHLSDVEPMLCRFSFCASGCVDRGEIVSDTGIAIQAWGKVQDRPLASGLLLARACSEACSTG